MKKEILVGHILAGLAGCLVPLAFSPTDWWPVLLLTTTTLYLLMQGLTPRQAYLRGTLFGLGMFGTGASWVYVSIHQFGNAPLPLAVILTGLFVLALALVFIGPQFALYRLLLGKNKNTSREHWRSVLVFTGCWILAEWFRSWFLTGFPWLYSGYVLLDTPVSGLAPVAGVYGLSALLTLSAASVGRLIAAPAQRSSWLAVTGCVALISASSFLTGKQWTQPESVEPLSFAAVQPNIPQDLKWQPDHLTNTINKHMQMSSPLWKNDLVIWTENAIPTLAQNVPQLLQELDNVARNSNTSLVLGIPRYEQERYYNAIIATGNGEGRYYKQKLVPFGEFVPLESLLRGLISFLDLPMSSFTPGDDNQSGLKVAGNPVSSWICYEAVYPDFAAKQARGKSFLITLSNDTWFGKSIGPFQHFQMVRMRSLETGRWQVRATNDGITALIGPDGQVTSQIKQYKEGILTGKIQPMTGETPFMRYGSLPILFLSLLMLACAWPRSRSGWV